MEKNDLIEDWIAQETSPEEREEMERIMRLTESMEVPELTTKADAWDQLMSNIEETPAEKEQILVPEKKKSNQWVFWAASIAALLVVGYFSLVNDSAGLIEHKTGLAEMTTQTLPDESSVNLNAGSAITYDANNWPEARDITFEGEAFFQVAKGSPFTVSSPLGKVTVLGTSFNVFSRDNEFWVQCFTGKVKVEANGSEVVLTANQSAEIDEKSGSLAVSNFNPEKAATWRVGEFYFDAAALTEVIAELERQFGIEIEVSTDISNRFYTGFFSSESLTEALQLVFVPMGLNANINGSLVTIQ